MLNAAGSLHWFRDALAPGLVVRGADGGGRALGARGRGRALPALPPGRADAARGSGRATGSFTGLSLRHDRGALARAVLEGVAYGLRDSLELLRELGVDAEAGRVSGGGARSRLWLEIVASVLGLPLERTVVEEGSAYGAALLAGVADGTFANAQRGGRGLRPSPRDGRAEPCLGAAYEEGYARFRALYPALRGVEER